MTVTLNQVLKDEVKWPTDEELDSLTDGLLQNEGFCDAVCVVDGSEIHISQPSSGPIQRKTWSGKKHQNSPNVMFITKLDGEIIYYSPVRVGAHDQLHWNELNL